jgi:hypothetical protein
VCSYCISAVTNANNACLQERAKEARYAKQLALATNQKVQSQPDDGGRGDGSAISAMCFCTLK